MAEEAKDSQQNQSSPGFLSKLRSKLNTWLTRPTKDEEKGNTEKTDAFDHAADINSINSNNSTSSGGSSSSSSSGSGSKSSNAKAKIQSKAANDPNWVNQIVFAGAGFVSYVLGRRIRPKIADFKDKDEEKETAADAAAKKAKKSTASAGLQKQLALKDSISDNTKAIAASLGSDLLRAGAKFTDSSITEISHTSSESQGEEGDAGGTAPL
jgi:hypothetical protein